MNKKVLFPLLGNKHIEIYRDIYIHTHTQHYLLKFEVVNLLLYYKKKKNPYDQNAEKRKLHLPL